MQCAERKVLSSYLRLELMQASNKRDVKFVVIVEVLNMDFGHGHCPRDVGQPRKIRISPQSDVRNVK